MLWQVEPTESGMKLGAFLKQKLGERYSSRQIKQLIEASRCTVNKRPERFATALVGSGDVVTLDIPQEQASPLSPILFEPGRIIYEDDYLLIYDKPAGATSDNAQFLKAIKRKLPYLALVHRLDKETSGVLIFAKGEQVLEKMLGLFKNRLINKTYLAIVDGVPAKPEGVIDNYLGELHRYEGQTLWGAVAKAKGLHAITSWQCEKKGKTAALVRCFPKTGRTHQIRVHLSEMGHPILGDFQYGRTFHCAFRPSRCMLHALAVDFVHPMTGTKVSVEATPPPDFVDCMKTVL